MLQTEMCTASATRETSQPLPCCSSHLVQFYRNAEYLAISIAEYLRLGLDGGEAALVIARPRHWQRVKELLIAEDVDVNRLMNQGLIHYINAIPLTAEIMRSGQPDRELFFEVISESKAKIQGLSPKLRCYGEIVDILSSQNRIAHAMTIEGYWNEILEKDATVELMCGYQASHLQNDLPQNNFAAIAELHTDVIEVDVMQNERDEDAVFRRIAVLEQRSAALKNQTEGKRRIDAELTATKAQLLQVGKLTILGELCAGIAHELNNPLAIIKGCVVRTRCILGRIPTPVYTSALGDTMERLENIDAAATRMSKIVNKVLLFARQQPQTFNKYSINLAITKAIDLLQKDLAQAGIKVRTNLPKENYHFFGDSDLMVQALLNIMSNARDAIEAADCPSQRILAISAATRGEGEIEITVTDNGIGMDQETLSKVFYPFFTTKGVGQGTGLGMSITHGIITDHKGKITCESTPGLGSTFRIVLPRVRHQQMH